jgi:hypothetical protein
MTDIGGGDSHPSYFLVAVSTVENLADCREYCLAGFPETGNGAWTFADIAPGDYVSFLYGATAHDLYRVTDRRAVANADEIGPWPALAFDSGESHFPFRLDLRQERAFEESLVRSEFQYIAENLMHRGGYSRSHFQADRTTLHRVSQMGKRDETAGKSGDWQTEETTAGWVRQQGGFEPPEESRFVEYTLHALLRKYLADERALAEFAEMTGYTELLDRDVEILGERALPEGHVDILIRDSEPVGEVTNVPIEVKLNRCSGEDLAQLEGYIDQLEPECPGGILLAETIPRNFETPDNVAVVRSSFDGIDMGTPQSFETMLDALCLTAVEPREN